AEPREDLVEQAEGAAVEIVAREHVVAGRERVEERRLGAEAAREGEAVRAPLERGEARLERVARRVAAAGVLEALVLAGRLLGEAARAHDRGHDGAAGGIGRLAGVDREGVEAERAAVRGGLHGGYRAPRRPRAQGPGGASAAASAARSPRRRAGSGSS